MKLKKLEKFKTHFIIYPCERSKLETFGENSYSTTTVMLSNSLIELVAQG